MTTVGSPGIFSQFPNTGNDDDGCGCSKIKNDHGQELDILSCYAIMDDPPDLSDIPDTSQKPVPRDTPVEFSWRDYNGKDWTTPAKHQRNCGSCWAFAALGVLESMIKIREGCAELNPDLSEQYVLSCLSSAGSCRGGSTSRTFKYIKETTSYGNNCNGVIFESCFEYQADDDIPCSDKCENWDEQLVPILEYNSWTSSGSESDIESIKTLIMENGPVAAHMRATDSFTTWGALNHNPDAYYPKFRNVFGHNHVVMLIGWKDDSSINTGGYWICKNSWGTNWGYEGYFNIAYGSLNVDKSSILWADYDPGSFDWMPLTDTGGSYGTIFGEETTLDASKSIGVEGEIINYHWDFGDGNIGSGPVTTHEYLEQGKYTITLTITDSENNEATESTNVWVQDSNEQPEKPTIHGPNQGRIGLPYTFTFSSSDNDGNDLWYSVDWGDGTVIDWSGPYEQEDELAIDHSWNMIGKYSITVKVKDVFDNESEAESLSIYVKMPESRPAASICSLLLKLLAYFPILNSLINI
jgi:C1A family cysteine protease